MSDQTFGQLWRRLLIHAPDIPVPLSQEFVNTAYSRCLGASDWSGLRGEAEIVLPPVFDTGTVSVTQGSATVFGSGTGWTTDLVGRQFFLDGKSPFYTILTLDALAQSLTLDRPIAQETQVGVTYQIQVIYAVMPSDFLHFIRVVDTTLNWFLRTGILQETLDRVDPQRSYSGQAYVIAPAGFTPSGITGVSAGLRRFEIWPRNDNKFYRYTYIKKPALMSSDSDRPIFPIRGDLIRAGALAELCTWPGTQQSPNPYFDTKLREIYESEFQMKLIQAQREDQEITPTDFSFAREGAMWAPIDSNFLQTHPDFTWWSL